MSDKPEFVNAEFIEYEGDSLCACWVEIDVESGWRVKAGLSIENLKHLPLREGFEFLYNPTSRIAKEIYVTPEELKRKEIERKRIGEELDRLEEEYTELMKNWKEADLE